MSRKPYNAFDGNKPYYDYDPYEGIPFPRTTDWPNRIFGLMGVIILILAVVGASYLFDSFEQSMDLQSETATLEEMVKACDPAASLAAVFDQMVLGTQYQILSSEVLGRTVYAESEEIGYSYPEDTFVLAHYTVIRRPNHPSLVEVYSPSLNLTWFLVYPDNFNSMDTRSCGQYRVVSYG